jgi:hypothetical protein
METSAFLLEVGSLQQLGDASPWLASDREFPNPLHPRHPSCNLIAVQGMSLSSGLIRSTDMISHSFMTWEANTSNCRPWRNQYGHRHNNGEHQRSVAAVPDTMVVLTSDNRLLIRSDGVIHVLRRLGGIWKFIAFAMSIIPRPLRDAVYDFITRIRYRIFGRLDNVCPVTSPELRARFDD